MNIKACAKDADMQTLSLSVLSVAVTEAEIGELYVYMKQFAGI